MLKVSPTTSTIKEPGKQIVTVRNSDIAKFGAAQEWQTPLKVYADRRGPQTCKKLVEEQIQSHIKLFRLKLKGDKKMKHRKRDPGSGVSSSRCNKSRAMRGRILQIHDFVALRNQTAEPHTDLPSELLIPAQSASSSALQQVDPEPPQGKRTSDRNRRSPSFYGFVSSSDSAITAPPERPRRAGDIENFQPPSASVVETVQHLALQQPEECNISPVIGVVSPPAQQVQSLIDQKTPTLIRSMTAWRQKVKNYKNNFGHH